LKRSFSSITRAGTQHGMMTRNAVRRILAAAALVTNAQRRNNIAQRNAAAAEQFGMLPSISMGWDREAWGVREGGWAPVADYRALLQWARDELLPSQPSDSLGRRIVMLPNWNEFGEGHFLLPNASAGFGYLDAMREVFTAGGAHDDVAPTERQKRRFTVLYPRE
jgi:hypothetical protein